MKLGDFVMDRYANVGRVVMLETRYDKDAVCVDWIRSPLRGLHPNPFAKHKYLTVITKEVAHIVMASWG